MNSSSLVVGCLCSYSGVSGRRGRGDRFEGEIHKVMIPDSVVLDTPLPFNLNRGPMKEAVFGYGGGRRSLGRRLELSCRVLTENLRVCGHAGGGGRCSPFFPLIVIVESYDYSRPWASAVRPLGAALWLATCKQGL